MAEYSSVKKWEWASVFKLLASKRRVGLLFLILLAGLWYLNNRFYLPKQKQTSDSEPNIIENILPLQQCKKIISYIVKKGDTFASILTSNGVAHANALLYYNSLREIGLENLFPGDSIVLKVNEEGRIDTLSLLSKLQYWFRVIHDSTQIRTEKQAVEVLAHRCLLRGTLTTSLSQDICALGGNDALVAQFADIFAWDINFFVDPRHGDRFEILFERNYSEGKFTGYGPILAAIYESKTKTFSAYGMRDESGKIQYYDERGQAIQKQFLKAPLRYSRVSSGYSYGRRHPILGIVRPHLGVDYAAPLGTPVHAAADGKVCFAGWDGGYGKVVRINHGASYQTCYGHLHKIADGIRTGVFVKQGQVIGTVGSTGLATGPHLDYRFLIGGRYVNPLSVSLPSKQAVPVQKRLEFNTLCHYYTSIFQHRFPNQNGCFLLDVYIVGNNKEFSRNYPIAEPKIKHDKRRAS